MVKCLCPIIEDGSLLQPKSHEAVDEGGDKKNIQRMGIVWRAVEMCSNNGSSQDQEQLIHALMRGFASISAARDDGEAGKKDGDGKRHKKRSKSKGLSAKDCIRSMKATYQARTMRGNQGCRDCDSTGGGQGRGSGGHAD